MSDSATLERPAPTSADLVQEAGELLERVEGLALSSWRVADVAAMLAEKADESSVPYCGEIHRQAEWITMEGVHNYDSLVREAENIVALCKLSAERAEAAS